MVKHLANRQSDRKGAIAVLAAFVLAIILAFLAFSIDLGYVVVSECELQNAADAAALAGVRALPQGRDAASQAVQTWAARNLAAGQNVVVNANNVQVGRWDSQLATFSVIPPGSPQTPNAVRVTCQRTAAQGNPLSLFIAPAIGIGSADLTVHATAARVTSGVGTRFLIDEEMIDSDLPAIEQVAQRYNSTPDQILRARGFNQGRHYGAHDWTWADNFLDIPAGEILSLPTGQGTAYGNNDSGLFDMQHPDFPFKDQASFFNFLLFSETGGDSTKWGTHNPVTQSYLDPLRGVSPVTDASKYASFVDPNFVHVSPISFSDISTLNMAGTVPQVNALGLRRGLLAFNIVAIGPDPDGGGSVLPELVIRIVDPLLVSPSALKPPAPTARKIRLVQ